MYRKASFGSSLALLSKEQQQSKPVSSTKVITTVAPAAQSASHSDSDEEGNNPKPGIQMMSLDACEAQGIFFLQHSGSFPILPSLSPKGRLWTVFNFPVRQRSWAFQQLAVHPRGEFVLLSDVKGQLFSLFSQPTSLSPRLSYTLLQGPTATSSSITALAFLSTERSTAVVADATGNIRLIDTSIDTAQSDGSGRVKSTGLSKRKSVAEIVGTIILPKEQQSRSEHTADGKDRKPVICLIKCHPRLPLLVLVSRLRSIFLWDLQ